MAKQGTLAGITLKGSAELVAEFFSFGINSILYQRGIYPPETFTRVTQYNLSILVTTDSKLKSYLNNVVVQLKDAFAGAFDLLIYTDKDLEVPEKWEESGPQMISNSEEVRLRSFTTTIHKVNSMVAYKRMDSV
ncbi:mitotic spindle assembly checkpoint protein MAD2A [Huso huso]|uniref:Mitotic spindle assembly checkpoint protein MAD2A n=1 Tax=Huso huso TaxID=61971 RepID=A0ABR1AAV6_HUSHU